jgi:hypothetical protein
VIEHLLVAVVEQLAQLGRQRLPPRLERVVDARIGDGCGDPVFRTRARAAPSSRPG